MQAEKVRPKTLMINGKRYCTVNCDASYANGKAGLAGWIVCDSPEGTVNRFGISASATAVDNNEAELLAIEFALSKIEGTFDVLVINTDSHTARVAINQTKVHQKYEQLTHDIRERAKLIAPTFYVKHVKGHSNNKSPRDYSNRFCDAAARRAR